MSPLIICALGFAAFFILVLIRMPIGFAFIIVGCGGVVLLKGVNIGLPMLGLIPYNSVANYTLVSVPLFILMGQLAYESEISKDLYEAAYKIIGRFPGGVALATDIACTGFAACTGSSLASVATMTTIALPEMKRYNYDMTLATGCIAAGGTLGILIPPSTMFIIYGYLTEQSIAHLFIAGILPGILLSLLFLGWILFTCLRNPKLGPAGPSYSLKESLASLKGVWGMLALFLLVIGGMYFGIFTPTEAGATGSFGAFILALARRRLSWKKFISSLGDTAVFTCFLMTMLIGATIFNAFLVHGGFQSTLNDWIIGLGLSPTLLIIVIVILYIPMGMFMDTMAMVLLTVPIFFPLISNAGFDGVWFGVILVIMVEAAMITPPMGVNVFIMRTMVPDVPIQKMFVGIIPYFLLMLVTVALLIVFPQIALYLPGIMM